MTESEASERWASGEDELPVDDTRDAEAMDRVLKKWKENMQERSKNPRIALMVCVCVRARTHRVRASEKYASIVCDCM